MVVGKQGWLRWFCLSFITMPSASDRGTRAIVPQLTNGINAQWVISI
jgi:hypothetical protein